MDAWQAMAHRGKGDMCPSPHKKFFEVETSIVGAIKAILSEQAHCLWPLQGYHLPPPRP